MRPSRRILTICLQLLAVAILWGGALVARAEEFLDPEVAFKLSARTLDERTVEVMFGVAPGYYLYREQFKFTADDAILDVPTLPAGRIKFDETFQKNVETYRDSVRIRIPVRQARGEFELLVTHQGCADKGLCYPPQQRAVQVRLAGFGGDGSARVIPAVEGMVNSAGSKSAAAQVSVASSSGNVAIDTALRGGRFLPVVGVFLLAGVLLSLTPCVLPMLPILSSIIVGQASNSSGGVASRASVSRGRGFALAASYSFGMALVYTAFGVIAGLAGEGLAASLQQPWVVGVFAALLVALSLSMFGVYELGLPAAIAGRLARTSQRLPAGRFAGVFAMGGVSALIVSPCVAAPLAGALVYLSQTRDAWLGGTALFALAAGMSVPLLLVGASAGALLPRGGAWMKDVKHFFGLLLLGVALWTVHSVLPGPMVLALWGGLALAAALMLESQGRGNGARSGDGRTRNILWRRGAAAALAVCGVLQFVGAASGGSNPLEPLAQLRRSPESAGAPGPAFTRVHNVAEFETALRTAGRPVLLDFYADWCVSCKEMERFTFADPAVRQKLDGALLLKADVTANNDDDRALLKRFHLFGPPGTIFFDAQGRELTAARIAGFQNAERFVQTLKAAGL